MVLIRASRRGGIFVICSSDSVRGMIPGQRTHVGCRLDRALRTGVKGDQATNPRREAVRRLAAASATNRQSRTLRQLPDPSEPVNADGCGSRLRVAKHQRSSARQTVGSGGQVRGPVI
jgi:hypothetical protein